MSLTWNYDNFGSLNNDDMEKLAAVLPAFIAGTTDDEQPALTLP